MTYYTAPFPLGRARRLRKVPWIRDLVQEHHLSVKDLILPLFVMEGADACEKIGSMPGVERQTINKIVQTAQKAADLGIPVVALFPNTPSELRTMDCEEAINPDNLVNRATHAIKSAVPDIGVMLDVALDPYNAAGHDGIVRDGKVINDETLSVLEQQALVQAQAGADILGPSDMMDGRVRVIRQALENNEFTDVAIMSYSAKYASAFYGPFREAVGASDNLKGDKKTYQMNAGNSDEALRECVKAIEEGADMVMVKPGLPYLDICQRVKHELKVPTFAYQVSGEYAMIEAASQNGWIDRDAAIFESLLAFKRAGCDGVLTYFAHEIAEKLS